MVSSLLKLLKISFSLVGLVTMVGGTILGLADREVTPNVVLVITDDQGYGDLGYHGNTQIRTPNLDKLAEESLVHTQFYVSPVCAPTRASLMTGRYNYRTGVVDTYLGRAMMYPDEVTLAEVLSGAGYRTGIFGKWHLGDNYPLRAMDQGFQESLVHRGGGIGQPADPPGNSYFNPILLSNGRDVTRKGYCTDIFFRAAEAFIKESGDRPFFAYIATNAPHTPLQIDASYVEPYLKAGLDETTARVYGMISNIDDNMGSLVAKLDSWGLRKDTILIFMTDNGSQQPRYSAGLRGLKTSVFEGGIKVPFFVRWPSQLQPGKIDRISAHIDLAPTILEACRIPKPEEAAFDGLSLMPLWKSGESLWPARNLFFQAHRGDVPEPGRACAVRSQRYKLIQPEGWKSGPGPENPDWMLFDLETDPGEESDISSDAHLLVKEMAGAYQEWFKDVSSTRVFEPPAIALGTAFENPVTLTRQDWRGPRASWRASGLGHWKVDVRKTGMYAIRFRFRALEGDGFAKLKLGGSQAASPVLKGTSTVDLRPVLFEQGEGQLEASLHFENRTVGVHYVDIRLLDEITEVQEN